MKLDDAYNAWGQQSDNRELFYKTKTAFRKMWWLIPTNKPCSYYTLQVLGRALAQTNGAHSDKVSAASVMCHVLNYAYQCDPESMDKPRFGFSDIVNYEGTKPSPMVQAIESASSARGQVPGISDADDGDVSSARGQVPGMSDADDDAGNGAAGNCDAKGQSPDREPVKVQSPGSERPLVRVKPAAKAKREAELARRAGTMPKSVVQLDAKTLKPIKVWKSCHAPMTELGIRNVQRAVDRHGLAGGYYWCRPGDEETFKPADKRSSNGGKGKTKTKAASKPKSTTHKLTPVTIETIPITKEQRELHSKVFDRPTDGDAGNCDARGQSPDREPVKVQSPGIERPQSPDMPTDEQQEQLKQAEVQFQQAQQDFQEALNMHVEGVLQKCSQDEIIAELRRRHWRGTLHITTTIEL